MSAICQEANSQVEQRAEELYLEFMLSIEGEIREAVRDMEKYYGDKKESIQRVAVDNIREAKIEKLEREWRDKLHDLERRRLLAPSLEFLQIAYVEFEQ